MVKLHLLPLAVLSITSLAACVTVADEVAPKQVLWENTGDRTVELVDLQTQKVLRKLDAGESPYGVAVSPDGKEIAVGVEGEGRVKFFRTSNFTPHAEVVIGEMHHDHIVLTPDGKYLLDTNYHSGTVVGIELATMKEAFRIRGCSAPHVVKYGPKGRLGM